jgi:outer membrane murein-binding lipoprotein Lpp
MDNTAFRGLRRTAAILAVALSPLASGCAGNDGLRKQVTGLETQVTSMRADQDRLEERLAALELTSSQAAHESRNHPGPASERIERPRLKVIHLAPDDDGAAAEPSNEPAPPSAGDSAAHRPVIRGTGDRVIKVGDGDSDESTSRDGNQLKPVAELGKDAHGS